MEMDFKIASRDAMLGNEEYDESVTIHKQILTIQERKNNLEELLESLLDEINLAAISNDLRLMKNWSRPSKKSMQILERLIL